jgi:hypothetical protein
VSRGSDGKRTFFKTELISLGAGISVLISVGRYYTAVILCIQPLHF